MTEMILPDLVVVTGPPGAGKTTIANALAERLDLPLIAKDEIKETLADAVGVANDREASQRLGRATYRLQFRLLGELLGRSVSAIAEGTFNRAKAVLVALPPPHARRFRATRL